MEKTQGCCGVQVVVNGCCSSHSCGETVAGSPVGMVASFPLEEAPEGWLKCNGEAVSRETYDRLFALLGERFGTGDGITTFNLPDLRGEFLRGLDDGRGIDTARELGSYQKPTYILGDADEYPKIYGVSQISDIPSDNNHDGFDAAVNTADSYNNNMLTGSPDYWRAVRPRNIALLYCIKY